MKVNNVIYVENNNIKRVSHITQHFHMVAQCDLNLNLTLINFKYSLRAYDSRIVRLARAIGSGVIYRLAALNIPPPPPSRSRVARHPSICPVNLG